MKKLWRLNFIPLYRINRPIRVILLHARLQQLLLILSLGQNFSSTFFFVTTNQESRINGNLSKKCPVNTPYHIGWCPVIIKAFRILSALKLPSERKSFSSALEWHFENKFKCSILSPSVINVSLCHYCVVYVLDFG